MTFERDKFEILDQEIRHVSLFHPMKACLTGFSRIAEVNATIETNFIENALGRIIKLKTWYINREQGYKFELLWWLDVISHEFKVQCKDCYNFGYVYYS